MTLWRGEVDERFAPVADAFSENFRSRGERGAAVCVFVDGEVVVDLVGGDADSSGERPWAVETIVDFYSVGKALIGLLLLQQVDRGLIGLDDPIAEIWPDFAAAGKEKATIRMALCHRAGVPAIHETLTNEDLFDFDVMTAALAATAPWFEPGSRHAYHTNTYGHLIGELLRRTAGVMPGEAMAALAGSLNADVFFGVPTSEQARCAEVQWSSSFDSSGIDLRGLQGDDLMVPMSYFNPPGYSSIGVVNSTAWRSSEIPSTSGHGSARGVATIYAALLEPGRLLSAGLLAEASSVQSAGYCPVLGEEVAFGLGFKPSTRRRPFGPNEGAFGHFGTGGSLGFCDPVAKVAFGYVMNDVIPRWQSSRNRALIDAVYRSL